VHSARSLRILPEQDPESEFWIKTGAGVWCFSFYTSRIIAFDNCTYIFVKVRVVFSCFNWPSEYSVQAGQDKGGWQTRSFVQAGTDQMLTCCITWIFFYFVDTSVTRSFTSALCLVLSGIHNLLLLMKYTRQNSMQPTFTMQQQQCSFIQASRNAVYFRIFLNMPVLSCKFTIY